MAADAPSETLEYTPTWVVATVCSVIIIISLTAERSLHCLGKILLKKKQDALNRALQKLKEELMLLGFISLLLTVFQSLISNICVPKSVSSYMLPCKVEKSTSVQEIYHGMGFYYGHRWNKQRLLSSGSSSGFCLSKGKVPLLSLEALHQLHIFIFVLAVVHVVFSASTMVLGGAKIRKWKHWENAIQAEISKEEIQKKNESKIEQNEKEHNDKEYDDKKHEPTEQDVQTHNHHHEFVKERTLGFWQQLVVVSWMLLLVVGAKLDHIITKLALELQEKPRGPKGETQHVKLSNEHFWFKKPGIVLYLIQFILFQNSFEIAFFFWIWSTYGFHSCIMEGLGYLIPRLVIGVIIQVLCSYSTLPLYAIVTQMGEGFKESIFNATVQHTLHDWATQVKEKRKHQYGFLSFLNFHRKDKKNNNEIQMQTLASRAAEASHGIQQSASLQEIVVEDLHAV
nr:PREDICTED: MLO-like protein 13 isoform X2 [Musa acuminata subsp. malaccensis]